MDKQQISPYETVTPSVILRRARRLQRTCSCGNHTVAGGECAECHKKRLQRKAIDGREKTALPPIVHEVLRSPGRPLDPTARAFMEPRFGHDFSRMRIHTGMPGALQVRPITGQPGDRYEQEAERVAKTVLQTPRPDALSASIPYPDYDFSQVRVHTDARAGESARAVNALAYTVGQNIVFGTGQYMPGATTGKRLLAHELAHVVQQRSGLEPGLQKFTAGLDGNQVYLAPERGDTDADLDRILCPAITERKIAGRKKIDVTACLPEGIIKAMGLGPFNCADYVRRALGEIPPQGGPDLKWLLTPKLWEELLKKGYRIRGFGVVKENGKVEPAEGLSWRQLRPQMGDLVFMKGAIRLKKGASEPDPAGDKFTVTWDHVGFFIVRSRAGFDYHLAKDGDENPIGVYHTGTEPSGGLAPGAYVKEEGVESLLAYLGIPASGRGMSEQGYIPGEASQRYWELSDTEREKVNEETNRRFQKETGVTRKLDWNNPEDRPLARKWLRIRDRVMAEGMEKK